MKSITPTAEYLEKAKQLSPEESERLMARMRGRFKRRTEDRRLSALGAMALQLEYEDEELAEWRQRMGELREDQKARERVAGQSHSAAQDS